MSTCVSPKSSKGSPVGANEAAIERDQMGLGGKHHL